MSGALGDKELILGLVFVPLALMCMGTGIGFAGRVLGMNGNVNVKSSNTKVRYAMDFPNIVLRKCPEALPKNKVSGKLLYFAT
jgi:hypothetical protein